MHSRRFITAWKSTKLATTKSFISNSKDTFHCFVCIIELSKHKKVIINAEQKIKKIFSVFFVQAENIELPTFQSSRAIIFLIAPRGN